MVKVTLRQKNPENTEEWVETELYFDGYLKSNLDIGKDQLQKDFDQVWFVDGGEGTGKSDFASALAYYCNKEETRHTLIKRICLTPTQLEEAIKGADKYEAVVYDEAFGGMSASGFASRINRSLQKLFTEIRAKNLFVFIVAPTFMDIQKYFAIWRSKCLIHVVLGKNRERGHFKFYGENKKKKLYIEGKKKYYSYHVVTPDFYGRFTKQMHKVLNPEDYKAKKDEILNQEHPEQENKYKMANDILWLKYQNEKLTSNPKLTLKEFAEKNKITLDRIYHISRSRGDFATAEV